MTKKMTDEEKAAKAEQRRADKARARASKGIKTMTEPTAPVEEKVEDRQECEQGAPGQKTEKAFDWEAWTKKRRAEDWAKRDKKVKGRINPSKLNQINICPGSYNASKGKPELEDSEGAIRGTFLHYLISDERKKKITRETALERAGDDAYAIAAIFGFIDYWKNKWPHAIELVEEELDCVSIHPMLSEAVMDWGLVLAFDKVIVADWKFTWAELPTAQESLQLATEAVALSDFHEASKAMVYQVNGFTGLPTRYLYNEKAMNVARQYIRQTVEGATTPWAHRVVDDRACRRCRDVLTCAAVTAKEKMLPKEGDVSPLSPQAMADEYERYEGINSRRKALKGNMMKTIAMGTEIPGFGMIPGPGKRAFKEEVTVEVLGDIATKIGKDPTAILLPQAIVSPNQIEGSWGTSKPVREALKDLIEKRPGKLDLRRKPKEEKA